MKSAACQLRPVFPYMPTNLRCDWDRPPSPTVLPVKPAATTSGCPGGGSAMQTGPSGVFHEDLSPGQNRSCQMTLTDGNCFLPLTELPVNCLRSTLCAELSGDPGQREFHATRECHVPLEVFVHDRQSSSSTGCSQLLHLLPPAHHRRWRLRLLQPQRPPL